MYIGNRGYNHCEMYVPTYTILIFRDLNNRESSPWRTHRYFRREGLLKKMICVN